jgi:hypothetical protein
MLYSDERWLRYGSLTTHNLLTLQGTCRKRTTVNDHHEEDADRSTTIIEWI